jgi:Arrestin (or S-antigen), N-terminal domain
LFTIEKGRTTLPAGTSRFPFSYTLPTDVPSTFAGEHGKVRYKVSATIDKPWAFNDDTYNCFTVVGILNLNAPEYAEFTVNIIISVETLSSLKISLGAERHIEERKNHFVCEAL